MRKKCIAVFLGVFLFLYLLGATVIWLRNSIEYGFLGKRMKMSGYIQKHGKSLEKDLFGTIFEEAKTCEYMSGLKAQENCRKGISTKIAHTIIEEDLATGAYDWPNDLFFIKQEGNNFYRMGWEGKREEITMKGDFNKNKCMSFNSQEIYSSACEITERVNLPKGGSGYVVRLDASTEESNFFVLVLFIPFMIFGQPITFFSLALIVPLLGAGIVSYYFCKKNRSIEKTIRI